MNAKPKIVLSHAAYNQVPVVKIVFEYHQEIHHKLKNETAARWSSTLNSWYILKDEFHPGHFFAGLKGMAYIDYSALKQNKTGNPPEPKIQRESVAMDKTRQLSAETAGQIAAFKGWMEHKRYSENTIKTYTDAIRTFLKYYHPKDAAEIYTHVSTKSLQKIKSPFDDL